MGGLSSRGNLVGTRFTGTGIALTLAALALPFGLPHESAAVVNLLADQELNDAEGAVREHRRADQVRAAGRQDQLRSDHHHLRLLRWRH
jgi:hypothetical protein